MTITVILCTFNRCRSLAKALDSVAASVLPDSVEWEVLVVDNNSRDQTREVVEEFCTRYPGRFRYVFEPQPGKSYALNRGVQQARGEILAFMDDDVTVAPTWLSDLTTVLHGTEWVGAGGRILPERAFSPPRWLALDGPYAMSGILALFEQGDTPGKLRLPPYGTNMAFRKEMFAKYGGFRTDLGPSPGSEIRNEDTEFGRRLMNAGESLWYEPSAVVYHEIPRSRLRKAYFLTWWFDYGRAEIREADKRPTIRRIPRYYLSIPNIALVHLTRRTFEWIAVRNPRERFYRKCMIWKVIGWLVETHRQTKPWKSIRTSAEKARG